MDIEALKNLDNFCGTENYYKASIFSRSIFYTDGVKYLIDNADAHWLKDIIVSYMPTVIKNPRLRDFQVWELKVKDNKGVVTCKEDDGIPPAVTQKIEYTDFPLPEITLWVERTGDENGKDIFVILLPSEH